MHETTHIIIYAALSGACIPAGGLLAVMEHFQPGWVEKEFKHFVIAFGGGILVAAVALVLVPEGIDFVVQPVVAAAFFLCGGLIVFWVERMLGHRQQDAPQFSAMMLDYVPETIALGGMFAAGARTAPLLALLIGLQNLPEGFNAFRELKTKPGASTPRILMRMCALVPIGPILCVLGLTYLSDHPIVIGGIMLFAAGGILYLIFQDIAPQSSLQHHWGPPLGAVCGFSLGLLCNNLVSG
jgi:ZIP family zinc transporter